MGLVGRKVCIFTPGSLPLILKYLVKKQLHLKGMLAHPSLKVSKPTQPNPTKEIYLVTFKTALTHSKKIKKKNGDF